MTLGTDALTVVMGKLATVPSQRVQKQVDKENALALWVMVPVQQEKKRPLQPCIKVTEKFLCYWIRSLFRTRTVLWKLRWRRYWEWCPFQQTSQWPGVGENILTQKSQSFNLNPYQSPLTDLLTWLSLLHIPSLHRPPCPCTHNTTDPHRCHHQHNCPCTLSQAVPVPVPQTVPIPQAVPAQEHQPIPVRVSHPVLAVVSSISTAV